MGLRERLYLTIDIYPAILGMGSSRSLSLPLYLVPHLTTMIVEVDPKTLLMGDQYISITDRHNRSQIHLGSGLYSIVTVYNCHCEVLMLFLCYLQLIISKL